MRSIWWQSEPKKSWDLRGYQWWDVREGFAEEVTSEFRGGFKRRIGLRQGKIERIEFGSLQGKRELECESAKHMHSKVLMVSR